MTHVFQWRAFLGPKWQPSTSTIFYDWSALDDGVATVPAADTTLSVTMDSTTATITCADSSGFPAAGGVWVGPNGAGESWEFIFYAGNSANVLGGTTVVRQVTDNYVDSTGVDAEQTGNHTSGAVVRMWWPLDTADSELRVHETMPTDLSSTSWTAEIVGHTFPQPAMRLGHLVLIQKRTATTASWSDWENFRVGWVYHTSVSVGPTGERTWSTQVISYAGVLQTLNAKGVRVGENQSSGRAQASASGTLGRTWKEANQGEFVGATPDIGASAVVDNSPATLWISERFVGKANTFTSGGQISQFYFNVHPGLGKGHRWIELIAETGDLDLDVYLIADDNYAVNPGVFDPGGGSYTNGDRVILAENPTVFAADNPDNDAATVIDMSSLILWQGGNGRHVLTLTGAPTGGTFTIHWHAAATETESLTIAFDATAADVITAIEGKIVAFPLLQAHGPAGGPWILDQVDTDAFTTFGGNGYFTLGTNSLTGGTAPTCDIDSTVGVPLFDSTSTGEDFFDHLANVGGSLWLMRPGTTTLGTVIWGDTSVYWPRGATGTFVSATAPTPGQVIRYDWNTTAYETGRVDTPGYNPNGTEWVLVALPGMGLKLTAAIDNSSTADIAISNAGGASTDGLPASGTIQVGSEQISYTSKTTTAIGGTIARGAGSPATTAAAHALGDPVYIVVSGEALDALPVKSVTLLRTSGQPLVEAATVRGGAGETVRDPDLLNYTDDYITLLTMAVHAKTGGTADSYTSSTGVVDLSGTLPRLRWILVEITEMETKPLRAMLNEVLVKYDDSVFDSSSIIASGTGADTIDQVLANVGTPSGAYSGTSTATVLDYTTADDTAWRVITDLAEFANLRLTMLPDSKLTITNNAFWTGGAITESSELTAADLAHYEFNFKNGRGIGQVRLDWRSPDGLVTGTEVYPAVQDNSGRVQRLGPMVYADSTAAAAGALRRYFQQRRPYDMIAEVPDLGWTYHAGDLLGVNVAVNDDMEAMDRSYRIVGVDLSVRDFVCTAVLRGVQLTRYNER